MAGMTVHKSENNKNLIAALAYASRFGWSIFPLHTPTEQGCSCKKDSCSNIGKHPRTRNGLKDATTDEKQITKWWNSWPNANIGVATGEISGFIAIDIDPRHGGDTTFEDLLLEYGVYPTTVEAQTGGGGKHILFKHTKARISNRSNLFQGIDVRGDGGYIAVAPSLHVSGKIYEWEVSSRPGDVEIASIPEWLLHLLEKTDDPNFNLKTQKKSRKKNWTEPNWVIDTKNGLSEGFRDEGLFKYASWLREMDFDITEAQRRILDAAANCIPPFPEKDALSKVSNVWKRYPAGEKGIRVIGAATQEIIQGIKEQAATDPKETIKQIIEQPDTIGSLAVAINQDRKLFEDLAQTLRQSGATIRDVDSLRRAVNGERKKIRNLRAVNSNFKAEARKVSDELPNAPTPFETEIPCGWMLNENGVGREKRSTDAYGEPHITITPVSPEPIVITARLEDITDGTQALRVSWFQDGKWKSYMTDRSIVANARKLVDLAGFGFPVTSSSASQLVDYLAEFEAVNKPFLPRMQVSRQMGWQDGAKKGFLWGRTLIQTTGIMENPLDIERTNPDTWNSNLIAFRGRDTGDEQFADGFRSEGSYEEWFRMVSEVSNYPKVLLAVYASLSSPLLHILKAKNFIVDWANVTSTGKTSTLKVAASVWGDPGQAGIIGSWDATRVYIERASAVLSALPLMLDDTKQAKNPQLIGQTIYDVVSGQSKGRGSVKGTQGRDHWQTIMLSTGESQITDFTEAGGTRARVLPIWGQPFGVPNSDTREFVDNLVIVIQENYGHAGPRFLQFLLKNKDNWTEWTEYYHGRQKAYIEYAGKNTSEVILRLSASIAVIDTAAMLAHECFGWSWDFTEPLEIIWKDIAGNNQTIDRISEALAYVINWATSNQESFLGRHSWDRNQNPIKPSGGWAGKWDNETTEWEYIAFNTYYLDDLLKRSGFEPEAVKKAWRDRDWLNTEKNEKRLTKKYRMQGSMSAHLISIKREIVEKITE